MVISLASDPGRKQALFCLLLLSFVAVRVGSRDGSPRTQATCKRPHNSTGTSARPEQVESCSYQAEGTQHCSARQPGYIFSSEPVVGRFIVRFRSYKLATEHHSSLKAGIGEADFWRVVERENAAARFPTDFALIEIAADRVEFMKERLGQLPSVKDVHPERRVTRALQWGPQEECEQHSGSLCDLGHHQHINKRPGRFSTKPSLGLHEDNYELSGANRSLKADRASVTSMFQAEVLWNQGHRGELVKMGVFDTGIRLDHPHVKNIRERTNWTHEPTLEDGLGHGTFVAGVIGGTDTSCPGFAPEVELYTFRVFTNDQVSYTSWFLDAFNYAIGTEMNVVNLSIGGPDYLDLPFVEKVWEITSSGILMVSAIGNDGPLYGTLNNPADQNDVIGVGGIDYTDKIATFSSRGMSTWELPRGYGRAKPDVVAYGRDVMGSRIQGGCRSLSGTSVASPVVAGAVCLLASTVPVEKRWHFSNGILNPASMKQALVEGAEPIAGISMYEQGQGKLNLVKSKEILQKYEPRASVVPAKLDFTECPFLWPFCRQPIYANAMPLMFNATVLNGMGLTGTFEAEPLFTPTDEGGKLLDVRFEHSDLLWPWSGFLALYVYVRATGSSFNGTAAGEISFTIVSPPTSGELAQRKSLVTLPITVAIIPTPPRERRLLWDQFHSLRYPPAYLPRDSLDVRNDILDWHGDHPHTNYHDMYDKLRDMGYYLEVLGSPFSCFDASQYGALLLVDPEEEFYEEEILKLHRDVEQHGLGLIVFAEWYNVDTMVKMRFFDDNTRSWWTPITGGSNIPALNDLLSVFDIAFGDALLEGQLSITEEKIYFASGANIARFPMGGSLLAAQLADKATVGTTRVSGPYGSSGNSHHAVLGFTEHGAGRVTVFGDSNCLDSSHQRSSCFGMLQKAIEYVAEGKKDGPLFQESSVLANGLGSAGMELPKRRQDVDLTPFSTVLSQPLMCSPNAPLDFELITIPHRGASEQKRVSAITKLKDQPIVTNLLPVNDSQPLNTTTVADNSSVATRSGAMQPSNSSTIVTGLAAQNATSQAVEASASPPPLGLKRFIPVETGSQQSAGEKQGSDSNEASLDDAKMFLGADASSVNQTSKQQAVENAATEIPRSRGASNSSTTKLPGGELQAGSVAQSGKLDDLGKPKPVEKEVAVTQRPETTAAAPTQQRPTVKKETVKDLVQQAEERQQAKQEQREDSASTQQALDLRVQQNALSGQSLTTGVREEVAQQAVNRAENRSVDAENTAVKQSAGDVSRVSEGGPNKDNGQPKYDSIDPMGQQEGSAAVAAADRGRKETKFLESSGGSKQAAKWDDVTPETLLIQGIAADSATVRTADVAGWRRVIGSFGGFPQVLVVAGIIGVFILWHVRQRRRAQENSPLRDRGNSTRVLTLGMLGAGTDTSSMKSRQRLNMERSPTLGR